MHEALYAQRQCARDDVGGAGPIAAIKDVRVGCVDHAGHMHDGIGTADERNEGGRIVKTARYP